LWFTQKKGSGINQKNLRTGGLGLSGYDVEPAAEYIRKESYPIDRISDAAAFLTL
jgi:hypothetical protein